MTKNIGVIHDCLLFKNIFGGKSGGAQFFLMRSFKSRPFNFLLAHRHNGAGRIPNDYCLDSVISQFFSLSI